MRYLLASYLALCCASYPAVASAQASMLTPFVGVWSNSMLGCRLLTERKLESMPAAQASRFGVVEISRKGIAWPYNSGTTLCDFSAGEAKAMPRQVRVPAVCDYKGHETKESIFFTGTASELRLRFVNGFASDQQLVKCR